MIFAPDDMGDLHQVIVYHDHKIVSGRAVGSHDDEVVETFVGKTQFAADEVGDDRLTVVLIE